MVVGSVFGGDFSNKMDAVLALPPFLEKLRELLAEEGVAPDLCRIVPIGGYVTGDVFRIWRLSKEDPERKPAPVSRSFFHRHFQTDKGFR